MHRPTNTSFLVKDNRLTEKDEDPESVPVDPVSVMEWSLQSSTTPRAYHAHVSVAILIVFLLSPIIICSNALLLIAVYRFKRLRSSSNYFIVSLASVDFGVGVLLPPGLYFEFSKYHVKSVILCLLPYCLFILLCSVSLMSITAIAVDRCISLASPLRYNNIITHRSVLRYIAIFWIYSLLSSFFPLLYKFATGPDTERPCSFVFAVVPVVRILLFLTTFFPCASLILVCYGYVYAVARSHALAIQNSEITLGQHPCHGPKYGRTLAVTVGAFLVTWVPFQIAMLANSLEDVTTVYLGVLLLSSAAVNPWVYGYRSSEFRLASWRILEHISPHLSGALYKPRVRRHSIGFTSCVSQDRCTLRVLPNMVPHSMETVCPTFVEIPIASAPVDDIAYL